MQIISSQNHSFWGTALGHRTWASLGCPNRRRKQLPPLCETVTLPYYWRVTGDHCGHIQPIFRPVWQENSRAASWRSPISLEFPASLRFLAALTCLHAGRLWPLNWCGEGRRGGEKQAGVTGVLEDRDFLEMNEGNRDGQACMWGCMQAEGSWPLLKKSIDWGGNFCQFSLPWADRARTRHSCVYECPVHWGAAGLAGSSGWEWEWVKRKDSTSWSLAAGSGIWPSWASFALPLYCCVSLGKLVNLSKLVKWGENGDEGWWYYFPWGSVRKELHDACKSSKYAA